MLEYLDHTGKTRHQEIARIEIPKFKSLIKKYIIEEKICKKDEKAIIERWEKTHSPDLDDDDDEFKNSYDKDLYIPLDIGGEDQWKIDDELNGVDKYFSLLFRFV